MLYLWHMINQIPLDSTSLNLTILTQKGFEPLLASELLKLGATEIEERKSAVYCNGDLGLLYKANLCLRTAMRILVPVFEFNAFNEQSLYQGIQTFNWTKLLDVNGTLAVDATIHSDFFNHSKYVALKTKDAIVDQFRAEFGVRPNVDVHEPDLRIHVHIYHNEVTVSLDSSNESLHKRGYRAEANLAPLNEVTAAGLILHSGWNGKGTFMDGMCGSGTLLIEAALFAKNIPPQINRTYFGFMGWTNFNLNLWEQIQSEAMAAIVPLDGQIIGNDAVFKVTEIAKSNVAKMNLQNDIFITNKRFEEQRPPEGGGLLIMNPPYGERLEIEEINQFYRMIGDTLKNKFEGFDAWIISSNKEALKHMKLAASKRMVVWNGPLECKFHKFEMYKGSKRQPKEAIPSNE